MISRLTLSALCLCGFASAQSLVANLRTTASGQPSSGFEPFFVAGGHAVFDGNGRFGSEPYVTDGTPFGTFLLRDLWPAASSNPKDFCVIGNDVFFTANAPGVGIELWKTDGTVAGTVLLKDVRPGSNSSLIGNLTAFNGLL
ncbi:MAG: hypothetical protein KAI24_09205, partial [Planctomycetes bacterium]|nr:hypothetical protein [Planctomycetota bacterium]